MNKGLKAFNKIKETLLEYEWKEEIPVIEKELKESDKYKVMYRLEHEKNQQLTQANLKMSKALEVIKALAMFIINQDIGGLYNLETIADSVSLTKEEYDLLKEVLL